MATAHKATDHKTISALGSILSSLNPFKKTKTKSAHEAVQTARPKAKAGSHSAQGTQTQKAAKKSKSRKHGKKHHMAHAHSGAQAQAEQTVETSPVMTAVNPDPAHAPGHRKMDLSSQFNEATGEKTHYQQSALERNSRGDVAQRVTSPQRRIKSPKKTAADRGVSLPKKSQ